MIVDVAIPLEGTATSTVTTTEEQRVQTMLNQMLCPECEWGPFERPQLLATHRFNAHGVTASPSNGNYKQSASGTFICPECGKDGFKLPLLVGKHRHDAHGYTSPYRLKMQKRKRSKAIAIHHHPAEPTIETPSQGPDPSSVLYMFARTEAQLEIYAKQNGLEPKTFISSVAEMLLGAVA